jgi:hypothetical protein
MHYKSFSGIPLSNVGCKECSQIVVPSGKFSILERAKNRSGLSQVNKVDGPFLLLISWPGTRDLLTHHAQRHCHGGEFTCQARVRVFSSEQIPVTLTALPNNTVCPCAMNSE